MRNYLRCFYPCDVSGVYCFVMKSILVFIVASVFVITACGGPAETPAEVDPVPTAVTPHDYQSDLENAVALAMRRGLDEEELQRQIGLVARRHDLSDWRSEDESFVAIGIGLREASVERDAAEAIADLVSGGDARRRDLVVDAFGG